MYNMTEKFDVNKDVKVQNIVGSGKLPVEVDTDALSEGLSELIDDDKSYTWQDEGPQPGLYYEIMGDDGPQVTFHTSGSYIIRADDREELESANDRVISEMKELGIVDEDAGVEDMDFTVQNVVALAQLHREIRLRPLSIGLGTDAQYEPEVFPALDYSKDRYPCSFLVYGNGKVVIVGANSEEAVLEAMDEFHDEITEWV